MKHVKKSLLILTCLIFILSLNGCKKNKQQTTNTRKAEVLTPKAPGDEVLDYGEAVVDISNVSQGYVAVRYSGNARKISIEITGKKDKTYKYFVNKTKQPVYFPLTCGNGTYQIAVYENIQGDEYSVLMMDSFEVKLKNKFLPFLYPNQYVEFTSKTKAVKEAKKLAKDSKDDLAIVKAVYNYVVKNVKYDDEKAQNVQSGYLPSVDETLKTKKGICFDYAALMTAMLRSQGIPTKLEIGYSGDIYHAWISTWLNEKGWVDNIIQFDGKSWELMDPTLAANSDNKEDVKEYIGNGEHYVLRDVSFVIEPGEKVAFVGATGAGKSSILNLIGRYYDIQKGNIYIDGVDIRKLSKKQLRSAIGQMQQDVFIFEGDIESNIRLHDDIPFEDVRAAAEYVNASHFIEKLPQKYKEPVTERGATFSAGERQLLSFARTLAHKPAILVMDEATANIDTETEILIQEALEKLMKGRTTIMVAHRLSTIQHADCIMVMHKGKIRERGTHQELLAQNGIYKKLYELQIHHVISS